MLAFSTEFPEPGSYWAMTRVDVPMILTRLKYGEVRQFINACRHRGPKVIDEGQGKQPRFTCVHHAWTYGLDGKLLALPESRIFGDIDKNCYGLTELAVEERAGLNWGILTPGLGLDLDKFLGPEMDQLKWRTTGRQPDLVRDLNRRTVAHLAPGDTTDLAEGPPHCTRERKHSSGAVRGGASGTLLQAAAARLPVARRGRAWRYLHFRRSEASHRPRGTSSRDARQKEH